MQEMQRARVRPRWVVFALDISGSMSTAGKLTNAKIALVSTARDLLARGGDSYRVGVVSFGSSAQVVCRPTADLSDIEDSVAGISVNGTTAMAEGILQGTDLASEAPHGSDRDLVLLTDGVPDDRQRALAAAATARSQGIIVSFLSIGTDDVDEDYLQQITPVRLKIESADQMAGAMSALLAQSARIHANAVTDQQ